jgi:hypothetical protein
MIDPTRERIIKLLTRLIEIDPEMRFGQLVSWIAFMARPDDLAPTPNVEDDEFLRACEEHLENVERVVAQRRALAVESSILVTLP